MITATTRADAAKITNFDEQVFDLDAAYVEWVSTETRDNRQGVFHPSASGGCPRRSVYEYIGTPRSYASHTDGLVQPYKLTKSLDTFRVGHAVHGFTQQIMSDLSRILTPKGIEYKFTPEIPFDPETDTLWLDFGIGGTCDGLLEVWHPKLGWHQRGVIEIKTSKTERFEELKAPKDDHQMQANLYAFRFDTPIIWYWYFNKNTSDRKVFRRVASDEYLEKALNHFDALGAHVRAGTLPDRDESYIICPECEYAHTCQPKVLENIRRQVAISKLGKKGGFGNR